MVRVHTPPVFAQMVYFYSQGDQATVRLERKAVGAGVPPRIVASAAYQDFSITIRGELPLPLPASRGDHLYFRLEEAKFG